MLTPRRRAHPPTTCSIVPIPPISSTLSRRRPGWSGHVAYAPMHRSVAEPGAAADLEDGEPAELAAQYAAIRGRFPGITVLGGCCGTDHRHIERICNGCQEAA
jgi:S-methylmethionine-dependent homocysteine/selenocysteine methylase